MNIFRLGIKPRVYGGFGVFVVLGMILTIIAALQLMTIRTGVGKLGALSDNVVRALQTGREFEIMRRAMLQYRFEGEDDALKTASVAAGKASKLLKDAAAATLSDERRRIYSDLDANVVDFQNKRAQLEQIGKRLNEERATLSTVGDAMTAATGQLLAAVPANADPALRQTLEILETRLLQVRVANLRFQANHDAKGPAALKANSERAKAAIETLEGKALPDEARKALASTKDALSSYNAAFDGFAADLLNSSDVYANGIVPQNVHMLDSIGVAEQSLRTDFATTKLAVGDTISGTIELQAMIGVATLFLGCFIAFMVGGSIVRPIVGMTDAMTKLAGGDVGVEIPSQDSADEIGAMAKAVDVFKQSMATARQLEADTIGARAKAERERKQMMHSLAATFDQTVNAIVGGVSAAAEDLQTTARALSDAATETATQATTVAAASEQASGSVGSVASATEELSYSVKEISEQVHHSRKMAADAAQQAEQTDAQMHDLAQAAEKIGGIVNLIAEIAGQTNMLALNATIEAARAGKSGRGFAVVAQEVKALAEQTAKATAEIGAQITGIQASTQTAANYITSIAKATNEVSTIAASIASAVEEQGAETGGNRSQRSGSVQWDEAGRQQYQRRHGVSAKFERRLSSYADVGG